MKERESRDQVPSVAASVRDQPSVARPSRSWLGSIDGRVRRLLIFAGGVVTFLLVASVVQPLKSSAVPDAQIAAVRPALDARDPAEVVRALVQLRHPSGWPLTGALVGRQEMVLMHASPDGPRYSVFNHQGELMQADMGADEVYQSFPNLDINSLRLEPAKTDRGSTPIMLVVPDQDHNTDR